MKNAWNHNTPREGTFKCYLDRKETQILQNVFDSESYTVHLNNRITGATTPYKGTVCASLLEKYKIE